MSTFTYLDYIIEIPDIYYPETPFRNRATSITVIDKTKSSYADIPISVDHLGKTWYIPYLDSCFEGCLNLNTIPNIPYLTRVPTNTAYDIRATAKNCFKDCVSLTSIFPYFNRNVDYTSCFEGCTGLTNLDVIFGNPNNSGGSNPRQEYILNSVFKNCTSLTDIVIHDRYIYTASISINCWSMFENCTSLETCLDLTTNKRFSIRGKFTNCFKNCASLVNSLIPYRNSSEEIMDANGCFTNCASLTGNYSVKFSPSQYSDIFIGTQYDIILSILGDSINERDSAASSWAPIIELYNNVYVDYPKLNNAPSIVINAYRVDDVDYTVESSSGEYIYIIVDTTIDKKYAPDNAVQTPIIKINNISVTLTHSSGTNHYTGWYYIGDGEATISAISVDSYSAEYSRYSTEVFLLISKLKSVMEFLQSEDGVAFGKDATKQNTLDSAWEVHSDIDVNCGQDPDNPDHVLSQKQNQLTAGNNIQINNDVISATDTTYSAGTGINIVNDTISANIIDLVYPVGSIYMSANSTSPATFLGGTWQRITGKFLLGATDGGATGTTINSNASVAPGNSGGEATHTLTTGETPLKKHSHGLNNHTHGMSHTHKMAICRSNAEASGYGLTQTAGFQNRVMIETGNANRKWNTEASSAANTGGSTANTTETENTSATAHNNMPPFLAVYIWERTA